MPKPKTYGVPINNNDYRKVVADLEHSDLTRSRKSVLRALADHTVISMGRCNTLNFERRMESRDDEKTAYLFYSGAEVGDLGSLAARGVDVLDWAEF